MLNNRELGKLGECFANNYISENGYSPLEKNYRTKLGEIDIIAKDGDYIVFIEVKARKSIKFGYPREAVDYRKQIKIKNIANIYLAKNNKFNSHIRFDVIEIMLNSNNDLSSITLLKNAFQ
jgi:putative endonuclease